MPVCVFMYTSHSIHVDVGEQLQESVISFHHGALEPNPVIGLDTKHLCPLNHLIGSLSRHHFIYYQKHNAMSQILQAILRLENLCLAIEI